MSILAIIIVSYLIGSIPAGYIVGRFRGIDIRAHGSGNIGATNVVRVLSKKFGYPVFLFDFFKGAVAVEISFWLSRHTNASVDLTIYAIIGGICCVFGHSYPVWLQFKGGKGVATSLGVLFALDPLLALSALGLWLITYAIARVVSVASIVAAVALPILAIAFAHVRAEPNTALLAFTLAAAALVVWRHRSNIARLRRGDELRFDRK